MSQPECDQDEWERSSEEPLRTISKPAFIGFAVLFVVVLTILEFLLLAVIFHALGLRRNQAGLWVCGLGGANSILSIRAVDALLQRMGMSRSDDGPVRLHPS
ncbi:hypothetical protein SAMN05444166_3423 [Singulisphaera sp. GP187]|nr:hypothetical protein SAMN05444166_3423 [Singulisphaera sp. GP187]